MAQSRTAQLNIRSEFVRRRTEELVKRTGMTATRIIEEALMHYVPPMTVDDVPPGFVRKNGLIVGTGPHHLTVDDVQASIDETREGERD